MGYFSVRRFWPTVMQFTRPWELFPPAVSRSNFSRISKERFRKLDLPILSYITQMVPKRSRERHGRYRPTIWKIMRAAGWGAAGFTSYLVPQKGEESCINNLIRTLKLQCSEDDGRKDYFFYWRASAIFSTGGY